MTLSKLLLKIGLLALLVLVCSFIIRTFLPFFWCGPVIANKERVYFNSENKYQVVFLGSSRINHGIDPATFALTLAYPVAR